MGAYQNNSAIAIDHAANGAVKSSHNTLKAGRNSSHNTLPERVPPCPLLPRAAGDDIVNLPLSLLELERLLWLASEIQSIGGMTDDGAPVNSYFIRTLLGVNGKGVNGNPVQKLVQLKIIEQCGTHVAGLRCRKYRFTDRTSPLMEYRLTVPKLIQKYRDPRNRQRAKLAAARLPVKLWKDLHRFEPGAEFYTGAAVYLARQREAGKSVESMQHLLDSIMRGEYKLKVTKGRLYHVINRLPLSLRKLLQVEGRPVAELDLPNSHPCFLSKIFEPGFGANLEVQRQHSQFVRLARSGQFYERFIDCWEPDRQMFSDYAKKGGRAGFLELPARKGIKQCWQILINSKAHPERLFRSLTWKKFSAMAPRIAERMAAYRRKAPPALGREMRQREAALVAAVAARLPAPCVTIFDGWLCAVDQSDELIRICAEETDKPEHLGFAHLPTPK